MRRLVTSGWRFRFLLFETGMLSVLVLGGAVPASGAEDVADVTWAVQPSNENGPDGRPWAELELDPGDTATEFLAVRNMSAKTVAFRLTAADGFLNENGRFNILPSDATSTDAGTWVNVQNSVSVDAGMTTVVPYTVSVPANAEPGDHAAGVAASVLSSVEGSRGSSVGVESRIGFRVMVRVAGELSPAAEIQSLSARYVTSWNPFVPGDIVVEMMVRNTGNTRLFLGGEIEAHGHLVQFPPRDSPQEFLAGDSRSLKVRLEGFWPTFAVPLSVTVMPALVTAGGDPAEVVPLKANTVAWAVPWPQLILLLGLALILFAIFRGRIRSRRKVAALVEEARAQGRLEAK